MDITSERLHLLDTVVASAPIVLFALDPDGIFTLSEGRGLHALGYKASEVVGMSVYEVFADVPQIVEEAARALQGEEVESLTYVRDLVFDVHYVPVFDADGQLASVTGVATNITELKQAEKSLKLREKAIEASAYGITIADMQLPDQPLIYVNPGFEAMSGYSAEEIVGHNCRFLQGDDRDQDARHELRAALVEGRATTVTLRNYRKDGTLFWNELHISPIHDDHGTLTHYVGLQTDVTARKNYEERIQEQNRSLVKANHELAVARKRAEEATRLKSQFLATMSHELRTPLNAIIGYTEIQLAGMTGELNEEQTDYQRRVLANAGNLLQLINNLLDISKIEAGRMDIVDKPFNVADWLKEVVLETHVLAEEKGLEFEYFIDPRMPERVVGDPSRLKQIATNLISNAVKFTEEGTVYVEVRRHGDDTWKLSVIDTGIGIPSHMQETIFDEFNQVDGTNAREHKGSGLGLSIVRKLALLMGGNVRVKSTPGEGSVFTVFLPIIDAEEGNVS